MTRLDELERLSDLHRKGALNDEEFANEKRRLLDTPAGSKRRVGPLGAGLALLVIIVVAAFLTGRSKPMADKTAPTPLHIAGGSEAVAIAQVKPPANPTGPRQASAGLAQIFQRDMLGASAAYLETFTGPARDVNGITRTYVVEGCDVSATVVDGKVRALGLPTLSSRCTVSLAGFGFNGPLSDKATFGMFQALGFRTRYTADCLRSCGNAYDPSVYATVETPHANGFVEFRVGAVQSQDQALNAANKWEDAMEADHGEDWLISGEFNCTNHYDPLASHLFKNVRITSLEVGAFDRQDGCS